MLITQILAWNNNETSIKMLQHAFLYRNHECDIDSCVQDVLSGFRKNFAKEGDTERLSMEFLNDCVHEKFSLMSYIDCIDPSVCDARGNGALMLAVVRISCTIKFK